MKLRGGVLGIAISLATAGLIAGCGSSNNSGTGGAAGGGTGGKGGTAGGGTGGKGGTAGAGVGGTAGAGAGGKADGGVDAPADAGTDTMADSGAVDTGPPRCGPFADGGVPSDAGIAIDASSPNANFFVTSDTSATANLGGLVGADIRCQMLAVAAGMGARTWHAYLSVEHGPGGDAGTATINARDRIGAGPWYNVRGVMVAADLAALHTRKGDPTVFIDEHGVMINGQWTGSPAPNQHDILTGSNADGTVAMGKTCSDWTSAVAPPLADGGPPDAGSVDAAGSLFVARVGHTDGFGGNCTSTPVPPADVSSWNSAHDNGGCNDTIPRGGAGRLYCFGIN
jgi:hypothetical protein